MQTRKQINYTIMIGTVIFAITIAWFLAGMHKTNNFTKTSQEIGDPSFYPIFIFMMTILFTGTFFLFFKEVILHTFRNKKADKVLKKIDIDKFKSEISPFLFLMTKSFRELPTELVIRNDNMHYAYKSNYIKRRISKTKISEIKILINSLLSQEFTREEIDVIFKSKIAIEIPQTAPAAHQILKAYKKWPKELTAPSFNTE
jgi:hypothetical protein